MLKAFPLSFYVREDYNFSWLIMKKQKGQEYIMSRTSHHEILTLVDEKTGKKYELPIIEGTEGPRVLDIRNLHKQTGMFTYDPGFVSTAPCKSKITFIDGDEGILQYRGYSIDELAQKSNYMEVCYLLLHGELPSPPDAEEFVRYITHRTMVNEQIIHFFQGFRRDAHPMAVILGVVGALSAFYHDSTDINDPYQRMVASYRLIAKMPTIAAMAYKYSVGQPFIYPRNDLSYSENFLHMTFSVPAENYKISPVIARAMDVFFILHADHEQNASTSTVRLAGSTAANPYACIAAGMAALWGPAHGGANEAVVRMLEEIGTIDKIPEYVARAKDRKDPFRLMGFGHRVYKSYDPRAQVLSKLCHEVLDELGIKDPLMDLALELERIALTDDYFVKRKLYPNVDFYSGIMLKAMGFPTSMFTALFAIGRTAGWIAHWKEMIDDPKGMKIGRPRQLYTGKTKRKYRNIENRAKKTIFNWLWEKKKK